MCHFSSCTNAAPCSRWTLQGEGRGLTWVSKGLQDGAVQLWKTRMGKEGFTKQEKLLSWWGGFVIPHRNQCFINASKLYCCQSKVTGAEDLIPWLTSQVWEKLLLVEAERYVFPLRIQCPLASHWDGFFFPRGHNFLMINTTHLTQRSRGCLRTLTH